MNIHRFRSVAVVFSVLALAFGVVSTAAAGARGPSLESSLTLTSAETWYKSTDAVSLKLTLTNNSDTTVSILRWQTPIAGIEHDILRVERDGLPVPYVGKLVKRGAPVAEDYLHIGPWQSASVVFDPTAAYDMGITGEYTLSYRTADLSLAGIKTVASGSVSLWIDGIDPYLAESFEAWLKKKPGGGGGGGGGGGVNYVGCTNTQKSQAGTAVSNAGNISSAAFQHLKSNSNGSALFTLWFGTYAKSRFNKVKSNFSSISDAFASQTVTIDCTCTERYFAYVYPNQPYDIYVCKLFWSASQLGRDSKAGTLVHEMSHFHAVAGTEDYVYGAANAQALARDYPGYAIRNADNHEYFAEDQ